ncbi:MAG: hypothetical protein N3A58_01225 [Spirochaetes bacterium]|nr:hypothetical protein [Spirochaetota bacterium]
MLEIENFKIPIIELTNEEEEKYKIEDFILKNLNIPKYLIEKIIFKKRSIDARNKNNIFIVLNFIVCLYDNNEIKRKLVKNNDLIVVTKYGKVNIKIHKKFLEINNNFRNILLDEKENNFNNLINKIIISKEFNIYSTINKINLYNLIINFLNIVELKNITNNNKFKKNNPVIIGCGPAGIFCALSLAYAGYKPIIIERGDHIDRRDKKVDNLLKNRVLDENSNIQYGEGGAGTYSDGKLTTNLNNNLIRILFNTLVYFGAESKILYSSNPHIGTDLLKNVVKNITKEIEKFGGKIFFNKKLDDFEIRKNDFLLRIKNLNNNFIYNNNEETYETEILIFATGNGATDIMELLINKGISSKPKPISFGVRIEHKREMIENSLYGNFRNHPLIESATYKLATHFYDSKFLRKRGIYTFCMCPGGYVIPSMTENNTIVTNGMSFNKRDGENSNSAILVDIYPEDYNIKNPIDFINFRKNIEKLAFKKTFNIEKTPFNAPGLYVKDFIKNELSLKDCFYKRVNIKKIIIKPTYKPGITYTNFDDILPPEVIQAIKFGLSKFGKLIKNFDYDYAFLTGVETRSSSPVWVLRNENYETNVKNLYSIGEGSGFAGGIVSSAIDGINLALKIIADSFFQRNY